MSAEIAQPVWTTDQNFHPMYYMAEAIERLHKGEEAAGINQYPPPLAFDHHRLEQFLKAELNPFTFSFGFTRAHHYFRTKRQLIPGMYSTQRLDVNSLIIPEIKTKPYVSQRDVPSDAHHTFILEGDHGQASLISMVVDGVTGINDDAISAQKTMQHLTEATHEMSGYDLPTIISLSNSHLRGYATTGVITRLTPRKTGWQIEIALWGDAQSSLAIKYPETGDHTPVQGWRSRRSARNNWFDSLYAAKSALARSPAVGTFTRDQMFQSYQGLITKVRDQKLNRPLGVGCLGGTNFDYKEIESHKAVVPYEQQFFLSCNSDGAAILAHETGLTSQQLAMVYAGLSEEKNTISRFVQPWIINAILDDLEGNWPFEHRGKVDAITSVSIQNSPGWLNGPQDDLFRWLTELKSNRPEYLQWSYQMYLTTLQELNLLN